MLLWASAGHEVPGGVTALFACLLAALIACLAFEEKLHAKKSVIAGLFALVCLLLGTWFQILPFQKVVIDSYHVVDHHGLEGDYVDEADGGQRRVHVELKPLPEDEGLARREEHPLYVEGQRVSMPVYVPAVDWGVIAIIFGSSLFVDVTSRSGLFTWIAVKVTKATGGDPLWLLLAYGVMTVVFSAVLNNVTAMIIVGSLTAVSLDKLGRRDKLLGFLLIEGLLTNIGGLLTLISSVPNIIVGTAAGISFVEFFLKSSPYVAVATAGTLWLGARLLGIRRLRDERERIAARQLVAGFDENDGVASPSFFWFSLVMTVLFIGTIASASVLPLIKQLEMGYVALAFGAIMLVRYKAEAHEFYKAIDWDLLGFFMALFVVINVMEHALVLEKIGALMETVVDLKAPGYADQGLVLVGSAAVSSVTDNIPLSAMLAQILGKAGTPGDSGLWWAVVFGANLGGNLTPIGSASTLVAVTVMHKHGVPMSFGGFVKIAAPYALLQIGLATVYVLVLLS